VSPGFVERRKSASDNKLIAPDSVPRTILLVEDNRDIREMIATALQGQGYRVVVATTPEEGVALLRQERYDLVVAHYNLPGMTAPVMLQEAAAAGLLKATPALVVTAHPDPQGVERESLVRKPLDLAKFLQQVQRIFTSTPGPTPKKERRQAAVVVDLRESARGHEPPRLERHHARVAGDETFDVVRHVLHSIAVLGLVV